MGMTASSDDGSEQTNHSVVRLDIFPKTSTPLIERYALTHSWSGKGRIVEKNNLDFIYFPTHAPTFSRSPVL